ncbi:uncharacterized protein LOC115074522 isoform X2 [Rhinatrema bivittatum]|uniref:uncharacterized protein LOC115074522 isoform X2 n=1 Tax=Rhinatrema bivittatum TaxID=194408 RepID=UPI00112BE810|nr:uncharacterized protein LOC115074522 isoform X2 [Rhinatrema bivittatum]
MSAMLQLFHNLVGRRSRLQNRDDRESLGDSKHWPLPVQDPQEQGDASPEPRVHSPVALKAEGLGLCPEGSSGQGGPSLLGEATGLWMGDSQDWAGPGAASEQKDHVQGGEEGEGQEDRGKSLGEKAPGDPCSESPCRERREVSEGMAAEQASSQVLCANDDASGLAMAMGSLEISAEVSSVEEESERLLKDTPSEEVPKTLSPWNKLLHMCNKLKRSQVSTVPISMEDSEVMEGSSVNLIAYKTALIPPQFPSVIQSGNIPEVHMVKSHASLLWGKEDEVETDLLGQSEVLLHQANTVTSEIRLMKEAEKTGNWAQSD